MIVRVGFLVAASIAAYAVKQINVKPSKPSKDSLAKNSDNGEQRGVEGDEKKQLLYSTDGFKDVVDEEEEKEEVKLINGIINPAQGNQIDLDDDLFPEFEDLLSGEIEFPLPSDKYDTGREEREKVYQTEMANNANELERLRNLVKELEEREVKLEGELLEYYGLKEQESDILELQKQLKIKSVEIDMLNITINTLQAEKQKLQEEAFHGATARKDLEAARSKIKELQRQMQLEANQTKAQLLLLKQHVTGLQEKEEEAFKRDSEVEKKLKLVKELEVEVMELKRKNKELQHEKRELVIKLDAAESKIANLSNMTENEMVAQAREEVTNLKHTNEDLLKQVEGLQMNRFSEVEELVYLRWVNACLRFELRNYQTPQGKVSARDLSKNLSPRSQQKAKQLMLEYAGSERGQGDTDLESNFSQPSSPGSEDFDNASIDSSTSRFSSFSKKPNLIQKLKKWGSRGGKDDSSIMSSPARSLGGASPGRMSMSVRPRGPLESLMLRNAGAPVNLFSQISFVYSKSFSIIFRFLRTLCTIGDDNMTSTAGEFSKLNITGDWASTAPNLHKNLSLLSPQQVELAKVLIELGQTHLFQHWAEPGVDDEEKRAFFDQIAKLNSSYPGGLAAYISTARKLLADSKAGKNPYDGFTPSVPSGEVLTYGDNNFVQFEDAGIKEARKAAFVLVAGGLGERLGYNGIKVALPIETTTGTCFLQHYIESILALQEASCSIAGGDCQAEIPLAIMTSDDTHLRTLELLEKNSYFGMKPTQVTLLKQEKVACLDDNEAHLALDPHNKYRIQTKPHGHGDVHSLLYSSGLLKVWHDAGLRWVLFFQDTNGLLFKAIPAALGVSTTRQYHVNSLAVPRKAKESIGGITKLTHKDGRTMVINVEYNQLDPLLRASGYPDGDVNSETGYSPFPGNINQLIFEIGPYLEELRKTGGAIAEFVNPKYKDATKTAFKSSTRLECMMQDYPKTLPSSARVGFTVMDAWLAYAPVKNNPEDAAKVPKGNPYHSATSGEMAIYCSHSLILRKAGVKVDDPVIQVFNGQEVEVWSRVVWKPKWALTFSDVKSKVSGNFSISQRSTMAIKGSNIALEDLSLDGALIIGAVDGAEVKVGGPVQNKGWTIENVDYKDTSIPEEIRIRGFRFNKVEQLEKTYTEPGKYSLKP